MIQFNLLPDIKIHYLKAKRQKHLVVIISVFTVAASLTIFLILLSTVFVAQKKNLNDIDKDIKATSDQLQSVEDLNKILTVQNQLGTLTGIHEKKVISSRLLDYLTQVTPATASISKMTVDYTLNTMTLAGSAPDLPVVNTYADTLKFTKYSTKTDATKKTAFTEVVLESFSRDSKAATYEISFKFDPEIFSIGQEVSLDVPKIISSRSQVDKPTDLFQKAQ